jgi:hypothetical protein
MKLVILALVLLVCLAVVIIVEHWPEGDWLDGPWDERDDPR